LKEIQSHIETENVVKSELTKSGIRRKEKPKQSSGFAESRSRYTFYNSYEKRNHGNPTVIGEDLLIRNNGKNQAINKIIESAKCEQQTSSNFDQKKSQCRAEITVCVASWHHSKKRME